MKCNQWCHDDTCQWIAATHILLLQVFSGVGDSIQQPHSKGDIFTLNLHSVVRHVDKNISKLGWAVNLNSNRKWIQGLSMRWLYPLSLYLQPKPPLLKSQPTSASWQRVSLVLLNRQLSHCGSSHTAPVSYVPPHLRVPLSNWIRGSVTPHGQGTEATWPISVSGHVTGPTLPQTEPGNSGQPSGAKVEVIEVIRA